MPYNQNQIFYHASAILTISSCLTHFYFFNYKIPKISLPTEYYYYFVNKNVWTGQYIILSKANCNVVWIRQKVVLLYVINVITWVTQTYQNTKFVLIHKHDIIGSKCYYISKINYKQVFLSGVCYESWWCVKIQRLYSKYQINSYTLGLLSINDMKK